MFVEPEEETVDNVEIWLAGYGVDGVIDLRLDDLGHPTVRDLLEQLRSDTKRPVPERGLHCQTCLREGRPGPMYLRRQPEGIRGVHFNPGDSVAHVSKGVSPEHEAYKIRWATAAEARGHPVALELLAEDGAIQTDVVVFGPDGRRVAIETQRSPQTEGTTRHRTALALERGLLPVWHTDKRDMSKRNEAAWLRTEDDLPLWVIEKSAGLKFVSGARAVDGWEYCVRRDEPCPKGGVRRCKMLHPNLRPIAPLVDDFIPGIAEGRFVPVEIKTGSRVNRFWTPAEHRDRLEDNAGTSLAPTNVEELTPDRANPNAAASCTQRGRIVVQQSTCRVCGQPARVYDATGAPRCFSCKDLSKDGTPKVVEPRPGPGVCSHWVGADRRYCRVADGVRFYARGHRCPAHTPAALLGIPELEPGPGWPRFRKAAGA